MSLVQAIITDDFVLVGAESCATKPDGSTASGFNKIIKLNKNIIFGCTGGSQDNITLFDGTCNYSEEKGFINLDKNFVLTYNKFVEIISERFKTMYQLYNRKDNPIPYSIASMICGYNGNEFEATLFNIEADSSNCIMKLTKSPTFPYKGISAGDPIHLNKLSDLVEETYFSHRQNVTLIQYKSILREVFTKGAKFDKGINNDIRFEIIKKRDVI